MKIGAAFLNTVFLAATIMPLLSPHIVGAEELKIDVSRNDAIKNTLAALVGKSATISTEQGEPISGVIEAVGPDAVKVNQLSGKEFYSAVIRLDDISAVTYRAK